MLLQLRFLLDWKACSTAWLLFHASGHKILSFGFLLKLHASQRWQTKKRKTNCATYFLFVRSKCCKDCTFECAFGVDGKSSINILFKWRLTNSKLFEYRPINFSRSSRSSLLLYPKLSFCMCVRRRYHTCLSIARVCSCLSAWSDEALS